MITFLTPSSTRAPVLKIPNEVTSGRLLRHSHLLNYQLFAGGFSDKELLNTVWKLEVPEGDNVRGIVDYEVRSYTDHL